MKNLTTNLLGISLLLIAMVAGCKKNEGVDPVTTFDRSAMLEHLANDVILPRYTQYVFAVDQLAEQSELFIANPSILSLTALKADYITAYQKYQHISPFEFGPAETIMLRSQTNIFPTDTLQILSHINSGTYDLTSSENADARGFPAIDYLLFRHQMTEQAVVESFSNSAHMGEYLHDLVQAIQLNAQQILANWQTDYMAQFVTSTGTDIASSTGYLVNQINFELDQLKNAKIAIPLGLQTLNIAQPQKCEAIYSAHSLQLALHSLSAIEDIYLGRDTLGNNGIGFDDYLETLDASYGSISLHSAIYARFEQARNALNAINQPIDVAVIQNEQAVEQAYQALIQLLVLLKTDMPSQLGIIINYQDGDGD